MKKWQKTSGRERRGHERAVVLLRAQIITTGGEQRAFLRNLSRSGALVDTGQPLSAGEEVTLVCGDTTVPGSVAWAQDKRSGLAFTKLLSEEEVMSHLAPKKSERKIAKIRAQI